MLKKKALISIRYVFLIKFLFKQQQCKFKQSKNNNKKRRQS
jgi:hypothetical protein